MADNTTLPGTGDVVRDVDRGGAKTQVLGLDIGIGDGSEKLMSAGQQTMANSMPVAIASDQAAVPISAAALPLPTGAATAANQATEISGLASIDAGVAALLSESTFNTKTGSLTETAPATDTASSGLNGRLQRIAQRITSLIALLPAALGANGGLKVEGIASGVAQPVSLPVVASATLANVAGSASSVTLLASNASRKLAIIVNDSTAVLYVKFGATASATSFTWKLAAGDTLEFPQPMYTGVVDGIWDSAAGFARTTEL